MDYSNLTTAADIIKAFRECQNAGEQIDLFEALARSYEPPVGAFVEILRNIKLERLIVLTIHAFGKIKDADIRERLKQSEDLLAILSEQAQSGETDSIRLSAAKTVVNLGFDFIAISRYFREDPKKIADRIMRDKSKKKVLFDDKYNEVRDFKSQLDRQIEQIKSINSDVYSSVIANNNFKNIPSINIEDDDEYDFILNNYVQSLRNESSRLQGEVTKFYKGYKENQLAVIDDQIARGKANLKKANSAKRIYCYFSVLITLIIYLLLLFKIKNSIRDLFVIVYSVFILILVILNIIDIKNHRKKLKNFLFDILLLYLCGGSILPHIAIKVADRKIESVQKNIEEAENKKSNEPYRLNDEEQKILNLLSI